MLANTKYVHKHFASTIYKIYNLMVILREMVSDSFCSKLYITRTIKHFLDNNISYYEMQEK